MYFRRTATQDAELHGATIRAGQKITLWYPSVNRDETVFPDADTFRRRPPPERAPRLRHR